MSLPRGNAAWCSHNSNTIVKAHSASCLVFLIQNKCNSQAFSIQELEAKLDKEVAQKRELERQLDENAETCCQTEVFPRLPQN